MDTAYRKVNQEKQQIEEPGRGNDVEREGDERLVE